MTSFKLTKKFFHKELSHVVSIGILVFLLVLIPLAVILFFNAVNSEQKTSKASASEYHRTSKTKRPKKDNFFVFGEVDEDAAKKYAASGNAGLSSEDIALQKRLIFRTFCKKNAQVAGWHWKSIVDGNGTFSWTEFDSEYNPSDIKSVLPGFELALEPNGNSEYLINIDFEELNSNPKEKIAYIRLLTNLNNVYTWANIMNVGWIPYNGGKPFNLSSIPLFSSISGKIIQADFSQDFEGQNMRLLTNKGYVYSYILDGNKGWQPYGGDEKNYLLALAGLPEFPNELKNREFFVDFSPYMHVIDRPAEVVNTTYHTRLVVMAKTPSSSDIGQTNFYSWVLLSRHPYNLPITHEWRYEGHSTYNMVPNWSKYECLDAFDLSEEGAWWNKIVLPSLPTSIPLPDINSLPPLPTGIIDGIPLPDINSLPSLPAGFEIEKRIPTPGHRP